MKLRESDEQERQALAAIEGKVVRHAYRGRDGWSDHTVFVVFEDGSCLHALDVSTLYFNDPTYLRYSGDSLKDRTSAGEEGR